MKKSIFVLGLSLMVLAGCSETTEPTKVEPEKVAEQKAEPKEEAKAPESFKVGDTVEIGDVTVKINEVKKSEGSDFDIPQKDHLLIFDITVANNGAEPYLVSSMMSFTLSSDGRTQDMYLLTDANGQLDGDIPAGKTMSGQVAYDVEESEVYDFVFTDDPFAAEGQATFEIKADDIQ